MAISKVIYKSSPNATPETWMDATPATAAASDIIAPKTAMLADGVLTTGTGSGGGGASNVVTGTFKHTEQGWHTISLPYNGNGYPVSINIYPKDGHGHGEFATTVRRYSLAFFVIYKSDFTEAPLYNGSDVVAYWYMYKSSTTDATSYANSGTSGSVFFYNVDQPTTNSATNAVRIYDKNTLNVRVVDLTHNTSRYGFLVNTDYTYVVQYSS